MANYSWFTPFKIVLFNSYVSLPEGMSYDECSQPNIGPAVTDTQMVG